MVWSTHSEYVGEGLISRLLSEATDVYEVMVAGVSAKCKLAFVISFESYFAES